MTLSFLQLFRALLPEAALVLGALIVLGFDLVVARRRRQGPRPAQILTQPAL